MPTCKKCGKSFPNRVMINDEWKVINRRAYCLDCSPHGSKIKVGSSYKCNVCGETEPTKFYGHKHSVCGKCHCIASSKYRTEKRKFVIDFLGGKCSKCGYNKHYGVLDVHHLDPTIKDPNFKNLSEWSLDRIKKEISTCILLCANCHRLEHLEE